MARPKKPIIYPNVPNGDTQPADLELLDRPKALCHPSRKNTGNGLCEQCNEGSPGQRNLALATVDEIMELHKSGAYVEGLLLQAKAIIRHHLPGYAEMHYKGAQIAAEKGDTKPAEWALERVATPEGGTAVAPVAKTGGDGGIKVFVGLRIGGMTDERQENDTITIEAPLPPPSNT